MPDAAPPAPTSRAAFVRLLTAAALLFTANLGGIALPPLDDCFYARKAAEMAEHPGMTVTWAGSPAYQNPPGHLWVMAASFRVFGPDDVAARLPTAIMALGILAGTAWLGARLVSPAAGLAGAALLAASPLFLNNARRVMMEIPLLFWTVAALAALEAARRRRAWLAPFAFALGMAVLVKSVLGLTPLLVAFGAMALDREWRALGRDPRFAAATAAGLALGASWPVHQWIAHGTAFLDQHFAREIVGRSISSTGAAIRLLGYPAILASQFQPVLLLALPGARRAMASRGGGAALMLAWALVPIAVAMLSAAQSARYVFAILPALALLGGAWIAARWPRAAMSLGGAIVPALLVAGAVVLWTRPEWLTRGARDPWREHAAEIRARIPAGTTVAYWGGDYWRAANPLLWYADRTLGASAPDADSARALAQARGGLLVVDRGRFDALPAELRRARRRVETPRHLLIEVSGR